MISHIVLCVSALLLTVSFFPLAESHTCNAIILNDTNFTLTLVGSLVEHGTLNQAPDQVLSPFSSTSFNLASNFGADDRMGYQFQYMPQTTWCNGSSSVMIGEYTYNYGSNSCSANTIKCPDGSGIMQMYYQNCNGAWGDSNPNFTVLFTPSSSITTSEKARIV